MSNDFCLTIRFLGVTPAYTGFHKNQISATIGAGLAYRSDTASVAARQHKHSEGWNSSMKTATESRRENETQKRLKQNLDKGILETCDSSTWIQIRGGTFPVEKNDTVDRTSAAPGNGRLHWQLSVYVTCCTAVRRNHKQSRLSEMISRQLSYKLLHYYQLVTCLILCSNITT